MNFSLDKNGEQRGKDDMDFEDDLRKDIEEEDSEDDTYDDFNEDNSTFS